MNFHPALVVEHEPTLLNAAIPPEVLGLDEPAARAEQPILAELQVQRDGDDLLVTGTLQTTLLLLCGRCAVWMPWPIRTRAEHLFEAPHPNSIDLTPFLREDILLELPLNAACQLGADGRCPVTGEFYQPPPESSGSLASGEVWAALSQIKPKN